MQAQSDIERNEAILKQVNGAKLSQSDSTVDKWSGVSGRREVKLGLILVSTFATASSHHPTRI